MSPKNYYFQRPLPLELPCGTKLRGKRYPVTKPSPGRQLAETMVALGLCYRTTHRNRKQVKLIDEVGDALTALSRYLRIDRLVDLLRRYRQYGPARKRGVFYNAVEIFETVTTDSKIAIKQEFSEYEMKILKNNMEIVIRAINQKIYTRELRRLFGSSRTIVIAKL